MAKPTCDQRKAHPRFSLHTSNLRDRYFRHKASARVRALSFELSLDEWLGIVTAPCVFCGAEPAQRHFRRQYGRVRQRDYASAPFYYNTIDRIDVSQGYHALNCQSACLLCNRLRSDLDVGVFTKHVRSIVANLDHYGGLRESSATGQPGGGPPRPRVTTEVYTCPLPGPSPAQRCRTP